MSKFYSLVFKGRERLFLGELDETGNINAFCDLLDVSEEDFKNPNVVKAVWSEVSKQCFYFSRQSLPYDRDGGKEYSWYQHIGVYSYKPKALSSFVKLPVSRLEDLEKLEQLRALENQMTIGAILTSQKLIGVDVPDDIAKVEGALRV
jgi:3-deoxy-manno-octulosonate cytidylyltransferase (CMP-KDO synthetase)